MVLGSGRSKELTASEAAGMAKQSAQDLAVMRAQVQRLRCVMQAMCRIMQSRMNVSEEELFRVADEIEAAERPTAKVAEKCPKCARTLQDSSSFCIYCGAEVGRRTLL